MTGSAAIDGALAFVTAVVGAWALYAGGRKALADARAIKTPVAPYEALAQRVTDLEAADAAKGVELNRLRKQVRRLAGALSREVAHVLDWIDSGAPPPPPEREVLALRELIEDINADID